MENYIEKLYVSNMGLFDELKIKFNPRFNFIVGPNGCGKTSIIRCIAVAISPGQAQAFRYKENSEVWMDGIYNNNNFRFGLGKGWVKDGLDYRSAIHSAWTTPPQAENRESFNISSANDKGINFTPLILGAYRRIAYNEIGGMVKEKTTTEKRRYYQNNSLSCLDGGYLPEVKQWMINRYFQIEKPWASKFIDNWEWLIENLQLIAPKGSNFKFKEIRQDLEPIFELCGRECYLEELSAGFQAILSLILAIFEWIETTNYEECILVKEATGTVIIDELDVHLHPEWQLIIRNTLDNIFPNLQFIITTHSPHLIASAKVGELIILPKHEGTLNLKPSERSYSGWNTDQILEEVMNVTNLENKLYGKLIKEAMEFVEEKHLDGLKNIVLQLEEISHPSDTIISVLKIKIASLELEE